MTFLKFEGLCYDLEFQLLDLMGVAPVSVLDGHK